MVVGCVVVGCVVVGVVAVVVGEVVVGWVVVSSPQPMANMLPMMRSATKRNNAFLFTVGFSSFNTFLFFQDYRCSFCLAFVSPLIPGIFIA